MKQGSSSTTSHRSIIWFSQVLGHGIIQGRLLRERSMATILSSGVERTAIGVRPPVNAYHPRQLVAMLGEAGFVDVRAQTRHFRSIDAFPYELLAKAFPRLRDPRLLDSVGRRAGRYVIGRAICP